MFNDEVELVLEEVKEDTDSSGNQLKTENLSKVLAIIRGVTRSEYYQAAQNNFKPSLTVIIHEAEYRNERKVKYKGELFEVIKTYPLRENGMELIELSCERKLGRGN